MLSIAIIHYETPMLLRQCLTALFAGCEALPFEVMVIDNASRRAPVGDLPKAFPDVAFHVNATNVGFAAACNQAMAMATGRYVLVLNPDIIIHRAALDNLVAFMDAHPDAGVCGPQLVYPNGELQLSCRRFPSLWVLLLRIFRLDGVMPRPVRSYLMADWDHAQVREVDWVIGGCMMLRREAVAEIGFLDDGFFMYYEDIDLCYRLKQAGWRVYYTPEVSAVHHHQRMSARLLPNRLSYYHARSLWRLVGKHGIKATMDDRR